MPDISHIRLILRFTTTGSNINELLHIAKS